MKFLLFCSIILSGLWYEAFPYMTVTEGQRAVLDCLLHADSDTRAVSWYKQVPGERPQMVLSYSALNTTQVSYGHGFNSSRFTFLTRANETYQHQLLITTTQEQDTAVYYCGLTKLKT